jgi:hypothetical protein
LSKQQNAKGTPADLLKIVVKFPSFKWFKSFLSKVYGSLLSSLDS